MSRISQDFIKNVGYLYEEINIQQQDFLNEDSQYYDAEAAELVEDILATISTSMVYEGYSAEGIIGFLADSSEETIIEKYLSFDESILTESVVSEDYIQEQLELFDVAIDEGVGDKLLGGAIKLAGLAGRIASKPARKKVANIIQNSKRPEVARRRIQNLAQKEARKGNVGGYSPTKSPVDGGKPMTGKQSAELLSKAKLSQATQKVKDIASKAKAVLPGIAKGALIGGTGVLAGYMGAKLAGAGGDGKVGPAIVGPKIVGPKIVGPKIVGPKSSSPSGGGGSNASGGGGGSSTSPSGSPKPKPNASTPAKPSTGETDMQKWAKANPTLAAKVRPGQSGYSEISAIRDKPSSYEKQDQTPTQGSQTAQIDTKSVDDAIKAEQERQKKRLEQQNKTPMTAKESYEPYDIVLNYLLSEGHADTLDEANYIMMEMDETAIGTIVEQYEDYLLAEEIQEWVNGLVEEGYDLSQYTWDDMVEYYVTQN